MVKGMNLVIVESPTKARTLGKYLGSDFEVMATYGHIRDLPVKKLGIKIGKDNSFEPEYVMVTKQKEKVDAIVKTVERASQVYLAPDPDREGEAIAWHVNEVIHNSKIKDQKIYRIVFHEITERAIKNAIANPGKIDMQLVDAQQARRVMDRLVGYKLSPVLWKKVRRGSSAGRVQSVAVRLIVEREREIEKFVPEEYWRILVTLEKKQSTKFEVLLDRLNGEKLEVVKGEQAEKVNLDLREAIYKVAKIEKKEISRNAAAPFTTSTLQQAGANKFGWSAKRTMQVAQMLYEGGYITYHRTDSMNLAPEAITEVREYIEKTYGKEFVPSQVKVYKSKNKVVAQEAHEAIRPTGISSQHLEPGEQLNKDQSKLYELIWRRFVGCQMAEAKGVSVKVSVSGKNDDKDYGLEARGEIINFKGWMVLNTNGEVEDEVSDSTELPELSEGENLGFVDVTSEQKFTQPPARYNDASLIKALEEKGIGRPSTYAPTISTIQERQYVEKADKRFNPTALGIAVNDFLVTNFSEILDYDFTANMEDQLDDIAAGERKWQPVVADFYKPFEKSLKKAIETADRVKVEVETTGEKCPKCKDGDVVIRVGRFGKFLACSKFPDCDFKANYVEKINMACPKCSEGEVIVKRTKSRKTFFGCSNYPKCDFASWVKPKIV